MAENRFLYGIVLLGCGIFYIAYGQWLAFLILIIVLALPWFSLLLSLPAILSFRVSPAGPDWVEAGEEAELFLLGSCRFPMPPFRGRLMLRRSFTGKRMDYRDHIDTLTEHCGAYTLTAEKVRICDYLGLFALPVRKKDTKQILVRPKPILVPRTDALNRRVVRSWKPKSGGFAENHELRLYRPGDGLNQVHWKLSAKTRKLMIRQPMEPVREIFLVTLNLTGSAQELDRKFGRLLWLGRELLRRELTFEIRCLGRDDILCFPISTEQELISAVDTLLCQPLAPGGDIREQDYTAAWEYHIGGQPDES